MGTRVNVNGRPGNEEDLLLSPLDQGFLFGASVYETVRTYDGVPFLLERHLTRLRESADALAIEGLIPDDVWVRRVQETLDAAGNQESSIRIIVSAGVGPIDYRAGAAPRPTSVIIVRPLPEIPEELHRDGARAVFVERMRAAPGGLSPRIKSSAVLTNILALREAHEKNAYEAFLTNVHGDVCEGSMSNIFIVNQGGVCTPPVSAGILEGITREITIDIARRGGYRMEEDTFSPATLIRAEEVFITASSRQIVPIVEVDGKKIANRKPGPVTRKLMQLYQQEVGTLMRAQRQSHEVTQNQDGLAERPKRGVE